VLRGRALFLHHRELLCRSLHRPLRRLLLVVRVADALRRRPHHREPACRPHLLLCRRARRRRERSRHLVRL